MTGSTITNQQSRILLRLVRRRVRRFNQMARFKRLTLLDVPIFFANSFPKSGTHLLTQVLIGFTKIGPAVDCGLPAIVTFEGDTGRSRTESEILVDLERLLPGDIAYGHVHAFPEVVSFVCRDGFVPYFILRDPRDVVVSHVHYVSELEPRHIHHRHYTQNLQSFDERLSASILGIPNKLAPPTSELQTAQRRTDPSAVGLQKDTSKSTEIPALPNIYQRFEPYMDWLDQTQVLLLHFEDFITSREKTIAAVYDHAVQQGFCSNYDRETAIQILGNSIDPQKSPTFRSGKVGGWHTAFTEEHKVLFKDIAGDLLIRLGYEQNNDW